MPGIGTGTAIIDFGQITITDADIFQIGTNLFDSGWADEMDVDVTFNPTTTISLTGGGGVLASIVPIPPALILLCPVVALLALVCRKPA